MKLIVSMYMHERREQYEKRCIIVQVIGASEKVKGFLLIGI
jgi:hypothetical protein